MEFLIIQRQCIFCENFANSKEHFWSKWMHGLLPVVSHKSTHERLQHNFHPSTGVITSGFSKRPGGVKSIQIRAVCRECNNGWMSLLERNVRPILRPLIMGNYIKLSEKEIALLSRWITMKCMVAENDKPDSNFTPKNDREKFKNENLIPEYYRIYVASNVTAFKIWYIRHSHTIAFSQDGPKPPLYETNKNIETITFALGHAIIHVNAARILGFQFEKNLSISSFWESTRIFPNENRSMYWPRRPYVDDKLLNSITNCLQIYIDRCDSHWK